MAHAHALSRAAGAGAPPARRSPAVRRAGSPSPPAAAVRPVVAVASADAVREV